MDSHSAVGDMSTLLSDLYERNFRPASIIDIGANNGAWSRMAKKFFKDSDFYMIEPLTEMEESLAEFCKNNPGSKYFICGAGKQEETLYLTVGGENLTGSNFVFGENEFLKKRIQTETCSDQNYGFTYRKRRDKSAGICENGYSGF